MGRVLKPEWVKSVVVGAEPGILTPRAALIFVAWNRLGVVLWPQERAYLWRLRGRSIRRKKVGRQGWEKSIQDLMERDFVTDSGN